VPVDQSGVDRLHAFRVLAHAEIEFYVEELATVLLDVTESYLAAGTLTHAGHNLVVSWSSARLRSDPAKSRYPYFRSAEAVARVATDSDDFKSAIKSQRDRIKGNHGVKGANVRQLLVPLGFRDYLFRPGLLDQLDNFGELRGSVAHATGIVGTTNWPSGSTELGTVKSLYPGLRQLEQFLPVLLHPS
jgi:hypothetical protein